MTDSRIAVLESKVASMENVDTGNQVKVDSISTQLSSIDTKLQLIKMRLDTNDNQATKHEDRIKTLEKREGDVRKWKKNALALATIIASTIASLFFKK